MEPDRTGGSEPMTAPSDDPHCLCGWKRPLIALSTRSGSLPPEDVFPIYLCPQCGAAYCPTQIPTDVAAQFVDDLRAQLQGETRPQGETVHVLALGFALCGFTRAVPSHWPAGHRWVSINDRAGATCEKCKAFSQEIGGRLGS